MIEVRRYVAARVRRRPRNGMDADGYLQTTCRSTISPVELVVDR
jgi:hypothetical protein